MYYYVRIKKLKSNIEKKIRLTSKDFSSEEIDSWKRLREKIKSRAWEDYKQLVKTNLFP